MAVNPMSATARQNSARGMARYGQRDTDCLSRPFLTTRSAAAAPRSVPARAAITVAAADRIACRLVTIIAPRFRAAAGTSLLGQEVAPAVGRVEDRRQSRATVDIVPKISQRSDQLVERR